MSSSELVRWGGLASMFSGGIFVVMLLIQLVMPDPASVASPGLINVLSLISVMSIVALLLLVAGLVGFHALQKESYGRIGRAGFYTVVVASLLQIVAQVILMSGSLAGEPLDLVGFFGAMVGFVLYGAATLQGRVLPRWCGVGFIVGLPAWFVLAALLGDFGGMLGGLLFGLLWLALGYVVWSRRASAVAQPARVS